MPSSTDLQQALALRKADPTITTADAVAQVRSSAVPAPVTPVAPMPVAPVSPTLSVNQQQRADNIASRQANPIAPATPVAPAPAPMVQAPVNPTTGLSAPLQPATPAPAPAPAPKADPTPGINPTTYAQANAESEKIKAQNEAQMSLNKQQSDLRQTETATANASKIAEAKQLQDQTNSALANNEGAILNTLKTGGIIPEAVKSSPYYQTAQQTYNKLQQYANYSTGDIVTAMNQGSILPGTTVYNEMMKDPAMKQKLTDAQIYKNSNPAPANHVYINSANDIIANSPTTASYLSDGVITFNEYNQATNNPAVVAKMNDVEVKTNKYNTLKAEYDDIETKVRADFPGSPFADGIIADQQKSKYKALQLASGQVDTANGTLTQLKSQASNLFETNLKLYESRRSEQNQIASEQRQVQSQKDMMQYQSDFQKKQAQAALNDPTTAITSVMDQYKKLGIPFTSTVQSRLAEFNASGKSLPDYLTQMGQNIQASPAYQKYQSIQNGQLSDAQKLQMGQSFDITKMGIANQNSVNLKQMELSQGQYIPDGMGGILNKRTGNVSYGDQGSFTSNPTAIGNIVSVNVGNKNVQLDQAGSGGFQTAISQLNAAGIPIVVGNGVRDQVATIKSMAETNKIPFNPANPSETAQALRLAGHPVADPGKSNHESGMAIDVYGSGKLDVVTPAQEKILNANGWYSANIPGDSGHFEYKGTQGTPSTVQGGNDITNAIQKAGLHDTPLTREAYNVANYNAPLTAKLKNNMPLMNAVSLLNKDGAYDPTFYDQKLKAMKDLTPAGYIGRSVGAFNTALHHLEGLNGVYADASNGNLPWVNKPINQLKGITGDPKVQAYVTEFNTMKSAVQDEVAKAFKGGVLNQSDVEQINTIFDSNSTPAQMSGFTDAVSKLLGGKLSSMMQQYAPYFDNNKVERNRFITPSGEHALNNLGYKINDSDYTIESASKSGTPTNTSTPHVDKSAVDDFINTMYK